MSNTKKEDYLIDYRERLMEELLDLQEAEAYLQAAIEEYESDYNLDAFMQALRDVAEAQGGMGELAKKTNLNRQNLYRILSKTGNPRLNTFLNIIHALGLRFSVTPLNSAKK
jgi:probable addiction module antidote protein